jgi:hypothetical protein
MVRKLHSAHPQLISGSRRSQMLEGQEASLKATMVTLRSAVIVMR